MSAQISDEVHEELMNMKKQVEYITELLDEMEIKTGLGVGFNFSLFGRVCEMADELRTCRSKLSHIHTICTTDED